VVRQLERGYTQTLASNGQLVRSAGAVETGQELVTRFADGTARSRVESSAVREIEETQEEETEEEER
jgi:exonuclease VII large subunit